MAQSLAFPVQHGDLIPSSVVVAAIVGLRNGRDWALLGGRLLGGFCLRGAQASRQNVGVLALEFLLLLAPLVVAVGLHPGVELGHTVLEERDLLEELQQKKGFFTYKITILYTICIQKCTEVCTIVRSL